MRFLHERVIAILLGVILLLLSKIEGFKYEDLYTYLILGVLPLWMGWKYHIKETPRKFMVWTVTILLVADGIGGLILLKLVPDVSLGRPDRYMNLGFLFMLAFALGAGVVLVLRAFGVTEEVKE